MDLADLALVAAIMAFAAAVQGAVGFGLNLFAAPLVILIEPELVPGPLIASAMVLTILMVWREPEGAQLRELGWAYAGRLPGTVLGALALAAVPTDQLDLFFGVLILLAVAITACGLHIKVTSPTLAGAGAVSGFMGTATSVGGPPMALLYQHEPGGMLRGTLARYFTIGGFISIATLVITGQFDGEDAVASLLLIPAIILGFAVSGPLTRHLDKGHTRTAVLVLSGVAAAVAVVKSLL
jgi:uncharacterized membrane protein YfcA